MFTVACHDTQIYKAKQVHNLLSYRHRLYRILAESNK